MNCTICNDTGTMHYPVTGVDYQGEPSEEIQVAECDNCALNSDIYGYAMPLESEIDYKRSEISINKGEKNMIVSFEEFLILMKEIEGNLLVEDLARKETGL